MTVRLFLLVVPSHWIQSLIVTSLPTPCEPRVKADIKEKTHNALTLCSLGVGTCIPHSYYALAQDQYSADIGWKSLVCIRFESYAS